MLKIYDRPVHVTLFAAAAAAAAALSSTEEEEEEEEEELLCGAVRIISNIIHRPTAVESLDVMFSFNFVFFFFFFFSLVVYIFFLFTTILAENTYALHADTDTRVRISHHSLDTWSCIHIGACMEKKRRRTGSSSSSSSSNSQG